MIMEIQSGLEDKTSGIQQLPSMPQVLLKLLEACNDEEASSKTLSDIISKDPSISARVMRLVNSAYIGLSQKVNELDKAVLYLGTNTIKNLAISASVLEVFGQTKGNALFNIHKFWWHSFLCASLAKHIAEETGYKFPEEAFLAGLMHDIGKLVLWTNFRDEYSKVLEKSTQKADIIVAEKMEIGATHCEIGAQLVRQWSLKSFLADAVYYHHEKVDRISGAFPLLKIVYVANILCNGIAAGYKEKVQIADSILNLKQAKVKEIMSAATTEAINVAKSFGIPVEVSKDKDKIEIESIEASKKELSNEIKTSSLLYGTLQNLLKADSRSEILNAAEPGLKMLFDVKKVFFFLHDIEKKMLFGTSARGEDKGELVNDLALSIESEKNLIIKTLNGKAILDSFTQLKHDFLTIADEQIIRLLGAEGMVCIPLIARGRKVGVIVIGANELQAQRLKNRKKILALFANHTAMCLYLDDVKRLQALQIEQERREASTAVARKVTHEVNNPLSIIKNYLKILSQKLPEEYQAQEELKIIGEEIDRVSHILKQLTAFSGRQMGKYEPVDINNLISGILKIIDKSILRPSSVKTVLKLDANLPKALTDKNSMVQVIMNLIKNAAEAMPEGGVINIETALIDPYSKKVISDEGEQIGRIQITIRDDGPGIPEHIQARMFEPSNSTKSEGHYGLGLSIVHSIVKELKGDIEWKSDKLLGTEFKIIIPISN